MASVNFPDPTATNPATDLPYAQGWYNSDNGITYAYTANVWSAIKNPTSALDDRYVLVIGDDMVGDLTLGTDKVDLNATYGNAVFEGSVTAGDDITTSGSLAVVGDVAVGSSSTFSGTVGDAVALLPTSVVEQFKTIIDGFPKAEPYGPTTLPADIPTPLKDALVRATTAGKVNLNGDDGSITAAGGYLQSGGSEIRVGTGSAAFAVNDGTGSAIYAGSAAYLKNLSTDTNTIVLNAVEGNITAAGDVGIGTEFPTQKLDVRGSVYVGNDISADGSITAAGDIVR